MISTAWAQEAASPQPAAQKESVLVLRSGGVLHGVVEQLDERYTVKGANSSVDVPIERVLVLAGSLEEAYQKQRGQLEGLDRGDTTDGRLKLAEWCLRYGLLYGAEQEIAAVRAIDMHDPRISLLERRLAVAKKPKVAKSQGVPMDADHDGETEAEAELRELEKRVAELPPVVIERFTRKVQPLLVNSCTASGCHRPGGRESFQLDRAVLHGLSNRRITLRNLVATLELVDQDSPQQSALVTVPRRTHGSMKRPVFGPRQEAQLLLLVDWIGQVAGTSLTPKEPLPMASTLGATPFGAAPIVGTQLGASSMPMPPGVSFEEPPRRGAASRMVDRQVMQASATEPVVAEEAPAQMQPQPPQQQAPVDPLQDLLQHGKVQFGADLRPWQPKDEFDAEIFNRAEAKRRQAAGAAKE